MGIQPRVVPTQLHAQHLPLLRAGWGLLVLAWAHWLLTTAPALRLVGGWNLQTRTPGCGNSPGGQLLPSPGQTQVPLGEGQCRSHCAAQVLGAKSPGLLVARTAPARSAFRILLHHLLSTVCFFHTIVVLLVL